MSVGITILLEAAKAKYQKEKLYASSMTIDKQLFDLLVKEVEQDKASQCWVFRHVNNPVHVWAHGVRIDSE